MDGASDATSGDTGAFDSGASLDGGASDGGGTRRLVVGPAGSRLVAVTGAGVVTGVSVVATGGATETSSR